MTPLLISFSGIDGAGKSTQIEKLQQYLTSQNIPVKILTFWDNVVVLSSLRSGFSRKVLQSDGQVGSPEKPANRNDKNSQSLPLLAGRSLLHLLDVFQLRKIVRRARRSNTGVVIFDRFMYDQLAALPLHNWLARAYARFVLGFTPKTDISFLLDAIPEEARARKPEYPLEFMKQYRNSYFVLRQLAPITVIAPADPEAVYDAILIHLKRCISNSLQPQLNSVIAA